MEENSDISIRKADESDIEFLFNLRNRPDVFKYFKSPRKVEYDEHVKWITPIINNQRPEVYLYVILCNNERVGQVRFDLLDKTAEISISVLLDYRGKGIADSALKQGIDIMKEKGIEKVSAEVEKENLNSIKFFKRVGFNEIKENKEYRIFEYNLK